MKHRLGTLISGGGTTMNEMIKAMQNGEVDMELGCVLASNHDAGGIKKARALGIPASDIAVVNPKDYRHFATAEERREAFGRRIIAVLADHGVTVVTQNGWLPVTPRNVVERYAGNIYNQHPGSPEDFGQIYGRQVHAAVLHFRRLSGRLIDTVAVAHRCIEGVDDGAVVKRVTVPVNEDDTVDALQQRVLPVEHRVQIDLLKAIATNSVYELPPRSDVFSDEAELLAEAKRLAKIDYPNG